VNEHICFVNHFCPQPLTALEIRQGKSPIGTIANDGQDNSFYLDDDENSLPDYLGLADLLALAIDPAIVDRLLQDTPLSGHGGRAVVPACELEDRIGMIRREEE
jgi:hypothetical protein